jgi:hypothetical protein
MRFLTKDLDPNQTIDNLVSFAEKPAGKAFSLWKARLKKRTTIS